MGILSSAFSVIPPPQRPVIWMVNRVHLTERSGGVATVVCNIQGQTQKRQRVRATGVHRDTRGVFRSGH